MQTKSKFFLSACQGPSKSRVLGVLALAWAFGAGAPLSLAAELPLWTVQSSADARLATYDGRVEALQQTQLAAQVPGAVLALNVRAGDAVRAGQVLLRIDASAAEQGVAASSAQVAAAQAALDVAASELARQRQLADKKYISQGALEQAESQHRAALAQVRALQAQTQVARTQSGFHVVQAPFDGVVSALMVERGDMAMPGRPLLSLYDPKGLRVTAHVPSSELEGAAPQVQVWLVGADQALTPASVQLLPTVDPATLTQELRARLPEGTAATPGQHARLQLAVRAVDAAIAQAPQILVPASAVLRRAEVTAVYVMGAQRPLLRQVRLGLNHGEQVEVLSGLDVGEQVITDPQAAQRALAERS